MALCRHCHRRHWGYTPGYLAFLSTPLSPLVGEFPLGSISADARSLCPCEGLANPTSPKVGSNSGGSHQDLAIGLEGHRRGAGAFLPRSDNPAAVAEASVTAAVEPETQQVRTFRPSPKVSSSWPAGG